MTDNALLSLVEGTFRTRLSIHVAGEYHRDVGARNCFLGTAWELERDFGPIPADQWNRVAQMAFLRETLRVRFDDQHLEEPPHILGWLTRDERDAVRKAIEKERQRRIKAARKADPDVDPSTIRLDGRERAQIAERVIGNLAHMEQHIAPSRSR